MQTFIQIASRCKCAKWGFTSQRIWWYCAIAQLRGNIAWDI